MVVVFMVVVFMVVVFMVVVLIVGWLVAILFKQHCNTCRRNHASDNIGLLPLDYLRRVVEVR